MVTVDPSCFRPEAVAAETRAFNRELERQLAALPPVHRVDPAVTRAARREEGGPFPAFRPRAGSSWLAIDGAPGGPGRLRISAPAGKPTGIYLHVHGGGWTLGAADEFDRQNQALAARTGALVASVAYRLAPEHPWPAAAADCVAALDWLRAEAGTHFGADRIVIGGESAGAHLAAVTLQRRPGVVAGAVLTYGCFDLRLTPSMRRWGGRELVLSTPGVAWFIDNLLAGRTSAEDPAVSPLLGDLAGMPPALFSIGTEDPLLDDTLFMAARWEAAGATARLDVYPGGIHAFDLFDLALTRAFRTAEAGFVADCLAGRIPRG